MFGLLCVYFILHLQLAKSDSELQPLLNLVSDQGKRLCEYLKNIRYLWNMKPFTLMWNRVIYINTEKFR